MTATRPPRWQPSPIAGYGLLGDTRTAALVSADGAVDWLCAPAFDGEPVFGALLGGPDGGTFLAGPVQPAQRIARRYRHHSATLETVWSSGAGRLTLTEAMVAEVAGQLLPTTVLLRRLTAEGAPMAAVIDFDPRLGEQHRRPRVRRGRDLVCGWGPLALSLGCSPELELEPGRRTVLTVSPGQPVTLVLALAYGEPLIHLDPATAWDLVETDEARWRDWTDDVDERIPFRETVLRSLLTLRLLTYSPSGAPVAAPTTSLPEDPGGMRNWDYRYAWPRDASIGVGSFLGAGKSAEARKFLGWLLHASRLQRPRLPAMLTLTGGHVPAEHTLQGWPGYAGSTPVRTGNGAASQHQLDGYGWVLDAAWVLVQGGHRLYSETWRAMRGFADLVAVRWQEPDAGIWEIRADAAQHVHSKMMGWLALDRALRIGRTHHLSAGHRRRWQRARDNIGAEIRAEGFDAARNTYTRTYGSSDLDAALLVLPLIGLEEAGSARVIGTVDAVRDGLSAGFPFLYRYPPGRDGLPGTEGAFLPCSFWLVQALAHTGRHAEATGLFTALLDSATPLGLYSEEIDPATGALLGNFPQALTHAALVQAALALRDTRTGGAEDATAPGFPETDPHSHPRTPELNRHDEEASDKELATSNIRSDSGGHCCAVRKSDGAPNTEPRGSVVPGNVAEAETTGHTLSPASAGNLPARTVHGHPEGDIPMPTRHEVKVRRIYEEPLESDGTRILVDRLWPRGLTKEKAHIDEWCKAIAPSPGLRKWYAHDPRRFEEFGRRYGTELEAPEAAAALGRLRDLARHGPLTLLTATKDAAISEAAVLSALIRHGSPPASRPQT